MSAINHPVRSFILALCLLAIPVWAGEPSAVTDGDLKVDHGQVNWTDRVIMATGSGAPDLKAPNVAVARLGAERVALLDALRNLLEAIKGVRINADVTIEKEMVSDSKIRSKVEGIAKGFKKVKTKYYSDGGVDVIVQLSIDGALGSTVLKPGEKPTEVPSSGQEKNTGLIVDARGAGLMPALAPKLLDEAGKVVYSADCLSKDALEQNGVVGYFEDIESAKKNPRTGTNPLVLKAVKASPSSKTDAILSTGDADKLRDPNTNLKYLAEGKVIIVTDD